MCRSINLPLASSAVSKNTIVHLINGAVCALEVNVQEVEIVDGRGADGGDDHEDSGHQQHEGADIVECRAETHCDGYYVSVCEGVLDG